jgi:hypothetical protein
MPDAPRFNADGTKIWKSSTRHVFLNLNKDVEPETSGYRWEKEAGMMMPMDSLESFREGAMAWLGDNSELSTRTLHRADWQEVYAWFKERREAR